MGKSKISNKIPFQSKFQKTIFRIFFHFLSKFGDKFFSTNSEETRFLFVQIPDQSLYRKIPFKKLQKK